MLRSHLVAFLIAPYFWYRGKLSATAADKAVLHDKMLSHGLVCLRCHSFLFIAAAAAAFYGNKLKSAHHYLLESWHHV